MALPKNDEDFAHLLILQTFSLSKLIQMTGKMEESEHLEQTVVLATSSAINSQSKGRVYGFNA